MGTFGPPRRAWSTSSLLLALSFISTLNIAVGQAPTCSPSLYVFTKSESATFPQTLDTFNSRCTDGSGTGLDYNLNSGNFNDHFSLDPTSGELVIKAVPPPDAEEINTNTSLYSSAFYLEIEVSNNEATPLFSFINVIVRITSTNDNTPEFASGFGFDVLPIAINVSESDPVGGTTGIYQCSVTDGDNTNYDDSKTAVQISGGNTDSVFAIDQHTCKVYLIKPLDYETAITYDLDIQAYDLGVPQKDNTQILTVDVVDQNDNDPSCNASLIVQPVDEGEAPGTVITTLSCSDSDDSTTLSYTTSGSNLEVDGASGQVTLASTVDTATGDVTFEQVVTVTDDGLPQRSTSVTVCVYVNDLDDEIPVMASATLAVTLNTDDLIGDLVTTIAATDADPDVENARITYGLRAACSQDAFVLNPYGGQLIVSKALSEASGVACTVDAYSSDKTAKTASTVVTIDITADNANPPVFNPDDYDGGTLTEGTSSGVLVVIVTATDADTTDAITFSMPAASPFNVDPTSGDVTLVGSLNYEDAQSYFLQVVATDDGSPSLSAITYLFVAVGPVNEFAPVLNAIADVSVSELAVPGFVIATAAATDQDAGVDGSVEYSLQDDTIPFVIDANNGEIAVAFALNYDTATTYNVVVLANDLANDTADRLTATTAFTVTVTEQDTHAPTCTTIGDILVTPDTNVGNIIGTLTCTDADTGETPTFGAISNDANGYFSIDPTSGAITLAKAPVEGTYQLSVLVQDGGGDLGLNLNLPVVVHVETNLVFDNLPVSIPVAENTAIGTTLLTVTASGSYAGLTYSLVGCSSCKFFLNPSTGALRLLEGLDYETETSYKQTIRVDSVNSKFLERNLDILVTDVNDNTPAYGNTYYERSLAESLSPVANVDTFTATDQDTGLNANIVYNLFSGNDDGKFAYDSSTGALTLVGALDYDTVQSYTLVLTATDRGTPALTGSTTVLITVTNVDEHTPEIIPAGGTISKDVPESSTIGSVLFTITATDRDFDDSVNFTIASGDPNDKFFIDALTGEFYLVSALDRETTDAYDVVVVVRNDVPQSVSTTVSITVTDVNDEVPTFNPGNYVFTTADNTQTSTSLGTVVVTDNDLAPNNVISLSIVSGDAGNLFRFTGLDLESNAVLSYVTNPYVLEVQAADGGNPSLSSTATVSVIIDPPYKQPAFLDTTVTVSFVENIVIGTAIYDADATASGATEGVSGDLQYSILSGDSANVFYMEPYSGQIILRSGLDFDVATSYSLILRAQNRNLLTLTATMSLTVSVTQVNLDTPSFSSTMYTFTVSEDVSISTNVGTPVQATDTDPGLFGTVSYSIETNTAIDIDSTSGQLRTKSVLEYSVAKSYYLEVYATDDAGVSSKTGTSLVIISVTDTNNHTPTFPNSPYTIDIPESLVTSTQLCIIKAEDLDAGAFGTVTYSITSGNEFDKFLIGAADGILALKAQVNFENITQYILTVEGADGGTPSLTGTATVTINVLEENDNAPVFPETRVELVIPTTTSPLTPVYTVAATDQDSGDAGLVNYIIQNGNTDQYFNIDPVNGIIATAQNLLTTGGYYVLEVIAVDEGTTPLTGTTTIAIAVQDFTNAAPGDYEFTIAENEAAGTVVGTIAKPNAALTITDYTITGGNYGGNFAIAITADQGAEITAVNSLDREEYGLYQLNVLVTHTTGTLDLTVKITVSDLNDNPPVFASNSHTYIVMEMTPVGTSIGQVTVSDADEDGVNTEYTLGVRGVYQAIFFAVDTATGIISTATEIDFECDRNVFTFRVVAFDDANPQQIGSTTVTVSIQDYPETENIIAMEPGYFMSQVIPFNLEAGFTAYTLSESDFGLTAGDSVVYTSASETGTIFTTNSGTGAMVLNENMLRYPYNSRLIQWVTCAVTTGATVETRVGVVRFDLFSRSLHMVSVVSSLSQTALEAQRATLLTRLDAKYTAPQAARIFTITTTTDETSSVAHTVGISNSTIETVEKIDQFQTFLTQEDVLKLIQAAASGTPASGLSDGTIPISAVAPYDDGTRTDDTTIDDPAVIAAIVVGVVAGVALIVAIFAVVTYACYTTRRGPSSTGNPTPRRERPFNNPNRTRPEVVRERPAYKGNPPKPKPNSVRVDPVIFQSHIFDKGAGPSHLRAP